MREALRCWKSREGAGKGRIWIREVLDKGSAG